MNSDSKFAPLSVITVSGTPNLEIQAAENVAAVSFADVVSIGAASIQFVALSIIVRRYR